MKLQEMFEDRNSFAWIYIREQVSALVKHPGFNTSERRDLEKDLWLELVRKESDYDSTRGQVSTFIARVLDAKIRTMIRYRTAAKRHFRHNGPSLNDLISGADGNLVELGETLAAETAKNHLDQNRRSETELIDLRIDMEFVLSLLNHDGVHEVAKLLMLMTRHRASREPGQTRRKIDEHFETLRKLIEDSDLRDYL